jgi:hypothetical protein
VFLKNTLPHLVHLKLFFQMLLNQMGSAFALCGKVHATTCATCKPLMKEDKYTSFSYLKMF